MSRKNYTGHINSLEPNGIFVFGSNTEGIHGGGAALVALKLFGAKLGQSKGLQGHSYGICTKDLKARIHPSVSKEEIIRQIKQLYIFATKYPELDFYIAYDGHSPNLNYYTPQEMADMFNCIDEIPENIIFEKTFLNLMKI